MSLTSLDDPNAFHENIATFGDRLTAARDAKGLTTASLAQKLGVDVATMEIWETDADMPRANRIQMLAGMLNVSIIWLISGESNGTTNIADTYERPTAINDALGEITQLKDTLSGALERLEALEQRLQDS